MQNFGKLKNELDNMVKHNFYIFTGEEREVLRKYLKRVDPNWVEAPDFKSIMNRLGQQTLFSKNTTYVIFNDKDVTEHNIQNLIKLVGKNRLILVYDKIDERKNFFKQAAGVTYNFEKFTEDQLAGIVLDHLDHVIGENWELARMIARYCNNEVSRIELEAHKLEHFDGEVTKEVIDELMQAPLEDRIFDMIEAFVTRKPKIALKLYHDLLQRNESPVKILSIMYTTFRNVFLVSSYANMDNATVAGKTGLTFYQVNAARKLLGAFTLERVARLLREMNDVEYEIKTGRCDTDQRVEYLLLSVF